MKMKSSFEALSREFVEKNMLVKIYNSLEDTSVRKALIKAVCLIKEFQKFHDLQNTRIIINELCITSNLLHNQKPM